MTTVDEGDLGSVPEGVHPGDLLGGAADEQQRQGGEHTEEDGSGAQPAGTAHGDIHPAHQRAAQDGAEHRQRDTNSS